MKKISDKEKEALYKLYVTSLKGDLSKIEAFKKEAKVVKEKESLPGSENQHSGKLASWIANPG